MSESCPICNKEFQTKQEWNAHMIAAHDVEPETGWPLKEKRMNCRTCAKKIGETCPRIKYVWRAQCRDWKAPVAETQPVGEQIKPDGGKQ